MNNLKFRIWNKKFNEFLAPEDVSYYCHNSGESTEFLEIADDENNLVFQQFTGLKDKNGKEIYEGDILKVGWKQKNNFIVGEIKFGSGGFYINKYGFLWEGVKHDEYPDGEVISNIFENPELLTCYCNKTIPDKGPAQCSNGHWLGSKYHPVK